MFEANAKGERLVKGSYFSESSVDSKTFFSVSRKTFVLKKFFLIVVIRPSAFHLHQGKRQTFPTPPGKTNTVSLR